MKAKKILVISFSNLKHDARVSRQIEFLKSSFAVTAACFDGETPEGYSFVRLKRVILNPFIRLKLGIYLLAGFFKKAHDTLYGYPDFVKSVARDFDFIIANDIESLPLAVKIKGNAKIIFDAHEYAPRHFEDKLTWRIFFQRFNKHLCKKFIPLADAMITINHGLADEYEKNYHVRAAIMTNANYYQEIAPSSMEGNKIRIVHHGAANPSRQIELKIQLMNFLDDRFTLDLYLLTPATANKRTAGYLDYLKSLAKDNPRIKIHPPVKSELVVTTINQYDIGICFVPHINFNYQHGLPNKLFDFVQARLAIAIGPTDEMTKMVETYELGIVSDNFDVENMAAKLNTLSREQVEFFKMQSNKAARELSAEKNREILLDIIAKLTN